jgi:membrane-bound ClpP family serine protease
LALLAWDYPDYQESRYGVQVPKYLIYACHVIGPITFVAGVAVLVLSVIASYNPKTRAWILRGEIDYQGLIYDIVGQNGLTITALDPHGTVEVGGKRLKARANSEKIPPGVGIRVLSYERGGFVVEREDNCV